MRGADLWSAGSIIALGLGKDFSREARAIWEGANSRL